MSQLSKFLYLLVIAVLATLAARPYWPAIQREIGFFHQAWQQVREKDATLENEDEESTKTEERARVLVGPNEPNEPEEPQSWESTNTEEDPFLSEARRRAEEDPEAAMLWLQEQGSSTERLRGMLEVVALWAADDSEAALLWLESNAQGLARIETLNSGVELWATSDPSAAANWIDGMANDGSKVTAARALAASWAQTDPREASQWLATLPQGEVKDWAALSLIETWSEQDPRQASQWALTNAIASGDDLLLQKSIHAYTAQDPEAAARFVYQIAGEHENPYGAMAHIHARAEQDPAGTMDWITGISDEHALYDVRYNDDYTKTAMRAWTETDSIAASAWLSEQAVGPKRDAAIVGFSESIQRFEPEAAVVWADTISDPEKRIQRIGDSVRNWAQTDREAALTWVISAELEPALQEQLAREIGSE